jgi:putative heme iron utilization protein
VERGQKRDELVYARGMVTAAALCRALARDSRMGALATVAREPAGCPYASLVAVAFDATGRPLFLLSRLAEHTKNLEERAEASLLVTQSASLDTGRMTLLGRCARVPDGETDAARATFLTAHPEAAAYASFGDFAMYRLEPSALRWIEGFGKMAWVTAEDYVGA